MIPSDPDDLLKIFGTSITDTISLTEYKNFREGRHVNIDTACLMCGTTFTTSKPGWGYNPRPVAVYCEWCRELNSLHFAKQSRYWKVVTVWSPPEEEPEDDWEPWEFCWYDYD